MKKIIITVVLLFWQLVAFGQENKALIKSQPLNPSQICGTFINNREIYKFKKNKKCKLIAIGPRYTAYSGKWKIYNDTLICTYTKLNTIGQGDNKELRKNPLTYRFIVYNEKLYFLRNENGHPTPMLLSKEE